MKKLLCLVLLAGSVGCAKKVGVHPGAVSNLDSYAYDVLLVEQDTINQAKVAFAQGQLPASTKEALNYAITQYNVTQAAWQAYHAGGANASALQSALTSLVAAVGELLKNMPSRNVLKPIAQGGIYVHAYTA